MTELLLTSVSDPFLHDVQITEIKISPDLHQARVYFYIADRTREREVLKGFRRSKGFLKKELSVRVQLRYVPDLDFFYDDQVEKNQKMDELFRQINHPK